MKSLDELQATLPEWLKELGVDDDTVKALRGPPMATPAFAAVRSWWATDKTTLVLAGGNGCGKTVAACSALRDHCCNRHARAYLYQPGDLAPHWVWRSARYQSAKRLPAMAQDSREWLHLESASLLIIDDAGKEDGDGERTVGNLLNERISATDKRTIVSTNLSAENFRIRYGQRLWSRLGGAVTIVHGRDLRLPAPLFPTEKA